MSLLGIKDVKDLKSCLSDFNRNAKASFVTMAQFVLEHCVEQILNALPGEQALGTFNKSSERLVQVTGIPDAAYRHELILVPAWIRNALHAGGIHKRVNKTVMIDGEPCMFEKHKRISCASWSHLMHVFLHGLDVYEEMFCSPEVAAIRRIEAE